MRAQIDYELALIGDLSYESYFLTVHDIVSEARRLNILCQGRGSAANSVVCYSLGVTEVDPSRGELLMERFISRERNEPPDIDIDFEHERREEVIQYIYRKYGRDRTALTATVISYRPRSALRDMAKVIGLDAVQAERLAGAMQWWDTAVDEERVREAGFEPGNPQVKLLLDLAGQLLGFPRHLSQHVGGFVISQGLLEELVPIENAAMDDRTVIEWDKDDLDDLGLLKVDVLGLGMLSALRRGLALVSDFRRKSFTLADIPKEDARVYEMISRADTIGVFQVESRAQMSMLPRLQAARVLRPGHRSGHRAARAHPGRHGASLSTPAAGSRAGHVSERGGEGRAVAHARRAHLPGTGDAARHRRGRFHAGRGRPAAPEHGGVEAARRSRSFRAAAHRGHARARLSTRAFARQIFSQIQGFGEYGFPESHAASFALLVYSSAWLKCYEPAAFTCALINSQPMGFYAPAQLVRDARDHGVEVRPDLRLHQRLGLHAGAPRADDEPALRLGLRLVKGLSEEAAQRIVAARAQAPFASVQDLTLRAQLARRELEALADAGALRELVRQPSSDVLAGGRQRAGAAARARAARARGHAAARAAHRRAEHRGGLPRRGPHARASSAGAAARATRPPPTSSPHADLRDLPHGRVVRVAGIVTARQRPQSAGGVMFITLEDETGYVNLIVWERVWSTGAAHRQRVTAAGGARHAAEGGAVTHVVAHKLVDRTPHAGHRWSPSRGISANQLTDDAASDGV